LRTVAYVAHGANTLAHAQDNLLFGEGGETRMAASKPERLVIQPTVPAQFASQLGGLWKWFKEFAEENLPNEELAPGEDGLPADSEPELDEVKEVEQVEVFEATDIGRGRLSVKCKVRLVITASLNDAAETVATVRPTWEMYLLVEPGSGSVIEHSHGWDGGSSWRR
jgi:hypothetical protein